MVDRGGALVGTPDDGVAGNPSAARPGRRLRTLVAFVHDWANIDANARSYDLFASLT